MDSFIEGDPRLSTKYAGDYTKGTRRQYWQLRLLCFKRLCLLPVGTTINLEEWYGPGWGTAELCIRDLVEIAKPMYRIARSDKPYGPVIVTKIR